MSKPKRSEQGSIIAYFSLAPLDQAEGIYAIVTELMRRRRREGKPAATRVKKAKVEPPVRDTLHEQM